jgi:hypothetical protein
MDSAKILPLGGEETPQHAGIPLSQPTEPSAHLSLTPSHTSTSNMARIDGIIILDTNG